MKVIRIAEGAFFVPPYFSKNIQANMPGLVNQSIVDEECGFEEEKIEHEDEFEIRDFKRVPNKVAPSKTAKS
jgi:hypothetical protein